VPVSVFPCFWVLQKRNIKWSPNGIKLFDDFSLTRRHPQSLEAKSEESRGLHKPPRRALGGRPWLVGPLGVHRPPSQLYKFTNIPISTEASTKILFRHRNLLFPWDPILGPFSAICRRGLLSRRASTSTLLPLRWCVSSLPQTYVSIASS
jgi:hypothetical protein